MRHVVIVYLLWIFCNGFVSYGQSDEEYSDLVIALEEIYGTDPMLVTGPKHYDMSLLIKGTPYLFSDNWVEANIFIKGREFFNKKIKYNVVSDELILFYIGKNGVQNGLVLNPSAVDSFEMIERKFLNLSLIEQNLPNASGFVEKIYNNDYSVIKTYKKYHLKQISQENPHGVYSSLKTFTYIIDNEGFHDISRKRDLLRHFKYCKRDIKNFLRDENIKYKKADNADLKKLFAYCDENCMNE